MRKCTLLPKTVQKLTLLISLLASLQFANAQAVVTASATTGGISACFGNASVMPFVQQFTASGTGLTNDIIVTAPANFEVSTTAASGYSASLTLIRSGSTVVSSIIYIRSAATVPSGAISGNITVASTGATSVLVATTGNVYPSPTINTITNQTLCNSGATTSAVNFTGTAVVYSWTNNNTSIGLAASGTGNIPAFIAATNTGSTPLTATVNVTASGIAIAYVANPNTNTVSVINTLTNTVTTTIGVGVGPSAVSVSPDGTKVYVANYNSDNVSVINTATNTVVATIAVGTNPHSVLVSPDGTKVYVANFNSDNVSVINTATNTVVATIDNILASPFGMAESTDGTKLYVADYFGLNVINTATNTVTATVAVGGVYPHGVSVSPNGTKVYVANFNEGTVSVINTATNTVTATVGVGISPFGVSVTPDGTKVYVANEGSSTVSVINTATNVVVATVAVGTNTDPRGISVSPDGTKVYVANYGSGTVSVISTASNTVVATVAVGYFLTSLGNFIANVPTPCTAGQIFTLTVNPPLSANQTFCNGTATGVDFTSPADGYSWSNNNTNIGLAASGTGYIPAFTATNTSNTALTATVTVTPTGSTNVGRAYVPCNNGIFRINTATATVDAGVNASSYDPRGVSVSPDGTKVYVANYYSNTVSVINTVTNSEVATVAVLDHPFGLSVSPDGTRVYVANGAAIVSVINTATNTVVANVGVGIIPRGVSVSPDGTKVFVANFYSGTVSVISTATNVVVATVTVGGGPNGVSVSPDGTKVYVANFNSGTVSVISTATNAVVATVTVGGGPYGVSVSPDGTKVYVANSNNGTVSVINTATNSVVATVGVGSGPRGVSVTPDGTEVYVVNRYSSNVSVINTATNAVVATISVGDVPEALGNFIANVPTCAGTAQTFTITVNPTSNASIATVNKIQTLPVTGITYFSNSCTDALIAKLSPNGANQIFGNTTATVWIETTQPAQFVKRHYEITPATGAATASSNVTLYFTQAEFDDFNAVNAVKLPFSAADAAGIANLVIEKRSGISSDGTGLPATYTSSILTIDPANADIIWNATQSRWEVSFNVVGFSGFFVKTQGAVLPLTLINFTGSKTSNGNLIQWQTASEINTKSFELERKLAVGSSQWVTIASQLAVGNGANGYSYVDADKLDGTMLYRLKMIDVDGRFTYSNVIKLTDQLKNQTTIYPNPVTNKATLQIGDRILLNTQANMIDAQGRIIKTILIKNSFEIIDMSGLPSGLYMLKLANGSSLKIIKE